MSVPCLHCSAVASAAVPARALYSPKETEAILNVSHATCYRLIAAGKLDARKLGGKTLITTESIELLVAELPKVGRAP
jgi:excisionase family DNA binding protein